MTKLVIGMESVEIKVAKKRVLSNLKMLNDRLLGLDQNSSIYSQMHAFYTQKMDEQADILDWLNQYDEESSSARAMEDSTVGQGAYVTRLAGAA